MLLKLGFVDPLGPLLEHIFSHLPSVDQGGVSPLGVPTS